jgi:hypothetical protein
VTDGRTDAAEDPPLAGGGLRDFEEIVHERFGNGAPAANLGRMRAMRTLHAQPAQVGAGDERSVARGAIEDEIHGAVLSTGCASALTRL